MTNNRNGRNHGLRSSLRSEGLNRGTAWQKKGNAHEKVHPGAHCFRWRWQHPKCITVFAGGGNTRTAKENVPNSHYSKIDSKDFTQLLVLLPNTLSVFTRPLATHHAPSCTEEETMPPYFPRFEEC